MITTNTVILKLQCQVCLWNSDQFLISAANIALASKVDTNISKIMEYRLDDQLSLTRHCLAVVAEDYEI